MISRRCLSVDDVRTESGRGVSSGNSMTGDGLGDTSRHTNLTGLGLASSFLMILSCFDCGLGGLCLGITRFTGFFTDFHTILSGGWAVTGFFIISSCRRISSIFEGLGDSFLRSLARM